MAMIKIRNWSRWQSYPKGRGQPPWIKLHRKVMRDPNWVSLTDAQRGQLIAIWLLAADHDGEIPSSPCIIQRLCYLDTEPDLQVFVDKGFLETFRQVDDKLSTSCQSRGDKSRGEESRVSLYSKKNITRPSKRRTIVYPKDFEGCWLIYESADQPNSSKKEASKKFAKLDELDKRRCKKGLAGYVKWLYEKRKTQPEYPAKHLETFINQEIWQGYLPDDYDPEADRDEVSDSTGRDDWEAEGEAVGVVPGAIDTNSERHDGGETREPVQTTEADP